jgi:muramoyltetrapeptide carboxypeptidase
MPDLLHPPALQPGDAVAIVATSSPIGDEDLARVVEHFETAGYRVRIGANTRAATGYLAGSPQARAADLMAAFTDPEVRLIVPATGGKGAAQLLPHLDMAAIAANPTILTGMSDPAILVNAVHAGTGLATLHGPSGYDFFQRPVHAGTAAAFDQITHGPVAGTEIKGIDWRVPRGAGRQLSGRAVGGHLGTIRALIGTPWLPDLTGALLLLEEVFVPWVAIDQALTHLRLAGVFDRIAGLIVGVPVDCDRDDAPDEDWDTMILRCAGGSCPVVTNVEFGHTPGKIPFVIGGRIELDLTDTPVLRYRDNLVGES